MGTYSSLWGIGGNEMKAKPNKSRQLKLLLFLLLGLNMSWFHNLIDKDQQVAEFASSEVAGSLSVDPSTRTVFYQRSYKDYDYVWKTSIQQVKKTKTDFWGNPEPGGGKEIAYKVSAKMVEGCYGQIGCHVRRSRLVRANDIGMSEVDFNNQNNMEEVISRIKELFDSELDAATEKKIKEKKELARQEKLEKEISKCLRNEDGEKIRGYEKLACKAEKLSSYEDDKELDLAFTEIKNDIRSLLASGDPSDRKRGRELLSIMGTGDYSKEINHTLKAMHIGASYLDRYTEALRNYLTTSNPWQKQMAYGQLSMLSQGYNMASYSASFSRAASSEFSYWQGAMNRNINLLLENPNGTLPVFEPSSALSGLPSILNNQSGRTLRQSNMSYPQNGHSLRGLDPSGNSNYLTVNPYIGRSGDKLTIPQINDIVARSIVE